MKIECHVLQNFAPSCLNRDDTNTPKDCEFGGARRARVSSQSWKKAMRDFFRDEGSVPVGERTKYLRGLLMPLLDDIAEAEDVRAAMIEVFLSAFYSKMDSDTGKTKVLLFISQDEIAEMVQCIRELCEPLAKTAQERLKAAKADKKAKRSSAAGMDEASSKEEKEPAFTIAKALKDEIIMRLTAPSADIALFGRMLAEQPGRNTDAACQVAHALSTHAVDLEMDFYTAVDDMSKSRDETGAGMLGTQGFNSACFYRYAVLDHALLRKNLGGDLEAANDAVEAFLRAFCLSIPAAKQNSHAAQNLPSLGLFIVRDKGVPVSLANAFAQPIRGGDELIAKSVRGLADYYKRLDTVYDLYAEATVSLFHDRSLEDVRSLAAHDAGSLTKAVEAVMARLQT